MMFDYRSSRKSFEQENGFSFCLVDTSLLSIHNLASYNPNNFNHRGQLKTITLPLLGHEITQISPRFRLELVERPQPLVLRHVSVERDGGHAEVPQHESQLDGGVACGREDDERVALHLVQQVDQVQLLVLERDEEVILEGKIVD